MNAGITSSKAAMDGKEAIEMTYLVSILKKEGFR